jgi:hypothetical protein
MVETYCYQNSAFKSRGFRASPLNTTLWRMIRFFSSVAETCGAWKPTSFPILRQWLRIGWQGVLLNGEIFYSLTEAKIITESWRRH